MNNGVILNMSKGSSFKIPSSLLKQLDECSFGGFVLFSFDGDGNPQVHSKFDNSVNAMALQQFVSNWNDAVKIMNNENTLNTLSNSYDDEIIEDDFDSFNEEDDEI